MATKPLSNLNTALINQHPKNFERNSIHQTPEKPHSCFPQHLDYLPCSFPGYHLCPSCCDKSHQMGAVLEQVSNAIF